MNALKNNIKSFNQAIIHVVSTGTFSQRYYQYTAVESINELKYLGRS